MRQQRVNADLGTDDRALAFSAQHGPSSEPSRELLEEIAEIFEEAGIRVPAIAAGQIEDAIEAAASRQAAYLLRRVFLRLEGSAAAVALRRVVTGVGGESLRDAAENAGASHVAIWKQEAKIRRRLAAGPAESQGGG